ncbi:NAD(P)/FAD-dependent oxidoreductase [Enterococcus sp.]|uniref:NAD(P)/FAD-dependent oxidoreductase n=1 Tax=Enterococcus sp. TaxID=35783 RepID=UPI002FC8D482
MEKKYDVIVIGAGPAGMMAAISAAENDATVLLVEKNKRLGKKMLLTGGGRCNVTNNRPVNDLITHIPGNGKFLYSTFAQWNNENIMDFFNSRNVPLKEEDHGRVFPVTDRSKTIVDALFDELKKQNVTVLTNTPVTKLVHDDTRVYGIRCDKEEFEAPCVIITTGGKTYPATGSTGDGYKMAKSCGHTVTPLFPTEAPLISEAEFILAKTLQGLSLQDVKLSVLSGKKVVTAHTMDLLFTHFGLSGPAALRCSYAINQELRTGKSSVLVSLDCFPNQTKEMLLDDLTARSQTKKSLKNALTQWLPERLLQFYLEKLSLSDLPAEKVTREQLASLVSLAKNFEIPIIRTFGLERAFVTGGGINLKEVIPKTLESKLREGLFFAGEVLDVNGYTGGYNVTTALCTGHVAGKAAAEIASWQN